MASKRRPVRTSSIARALPTVRVRRWVPPPPGMIASVISGWPNSAVSEATIMSQSSASSQPPPSAQPETAAIIGVRTEARRRQKVSLGLSSSFTSRSASALTSAPAANASSSPAMTMQPISSSASNAATASASSSRRPGERALRASGRFSRQSPTRPWVSVRTRSAIRRRGSQRVDPRRVAADDQLLDLRGALVQRGDPGVAQVALDRVVVDVARAAVDLDRGVGALDR